MSDEPMPVVTLRGIELPAETVAASADEADPVGAALAINRYTAALAKLERETAESDPDVFVTVTDKDASMLQSLIAEEAGETAALEAGGQEVKFGTGLEDPLGWVKSRLDWVDKSERHPLRRPTSTTPEPIADDAGVVLLSDWATGLYGAPVSAATIKRQGAFEVAMHLGDIYYSGTPKETESRFLKLWPKAAARLSRALNGNHEMYSGGHGYFAGVLPAFGQSSSYFALANARWLLIGLDTAYVDHDLDEQQAGWVHQVVKEHANGRRVLLFSHHQPFSGLGSQGPRLRAALDALLRTKVVAAWYWGHEHDCIVYEPQASTGLLGRCVGNGGMPAKRNGAVRDAPVAERIDSDLSWRSVKASDKAPACLVLDGPNRYIKGKEHKFVPNGYATLAFSSAKLTERIHLPDGTPIHEREIV
jgi:hypothetical protein